MAGLALAQTGQPVATGNWRHSGLLQGFVVVGQLQSIGAGMRLRQFAQHLHMPRVVSFHWGWRILVEIYNRDASGQAAQANWTPTDEPVTYEWGYAPSWLQAGSPFCSHAKLVRKAQCIATEQ